MAREGGRYGLVFDKNTGRDEYLFVPDGSFEISVNGKLSETEASALQTANARASEAFIIEQLSRLSLHKRTRVGESTAKAFFSDLASDIADVGEIALVETCARLRRAENPFFPTSHEIIKTARQVMAEIEKAIAASKVSERDGNSCPA